MTFARFPALSIPSRLMAALLGLGLLGGCAAIGLDAPPPAAASPVAPGASGLSGVPAGSTVATVAELARAGDAEAQATLGWIYETGRGVPRDPARAAKWYERAARQGNSLAQYALAELYSRGRGVPRDIAAAARLYRAAAEGGNASAQYKLGALYETGRGVPRDYRRAAYWYARAGETWAATANPPPGVERLAGAQPAPTLVAPSSAPAAKTGGTPSGTPAAAPQAAGKRTAEETTAEETPAEETPAKGAATEDAAGGEAAAVKAGLALLPEGAKASPDDPGAWPASAWRVHLASFRTRRGAARAQAEIAKKAGDALAGYGFDLVDVDLGAPLGAWVRVTLGPLKGRAEARALCRRLAARDLYCRPLAPGQ